MFGPTCTSPSTVCMTGNISYCCRTEKSPTRHYWHADADRLIALIVARSIRYSDVNLPYAERIALSRLPLLDKLYPAGVTIGCRKLVRVELDAKGVCGFLMTSHRRATAWVQNVSNRSFSRIRNHINIYRAIR